MRNPFNRRQPAAAVGYSSVFRSVRRRERRGLLRWWRWALFVVLALVLGAGGYGSWLFFRTQNAIRDPGIVVPPPREGQPFNALLVGSDSRAGLSEKQQLELGASAVGQDAPRADTLILAHIDPDAESVTMVQFPRDLYVPLPGGGRDRINAALEEGSNYVIDSVEALTGLTINQYVQVNIAGFLELVDAIDGVDVCITEPIPFDPKTGIQVTPDEVGIVHFDGERALRFVRSRQVFAEGDFARIQNQQKFLAAAINKVTSTSTFLRPARLQRVADVAAEHVKVDASTTIPGLRRLMERFRSFDPEHYEAYTVPNLGPSTTPRGASVVKPNWPAIELLFDAIANNQSPAVVDGVPDVDPASIDVGVYNGTLTEGRAATAAKALRAATDTGTGGVGIEGDDIANAPSSGFRETVVRYRPDRRRAAELVHAAIPGALLEEGETFGNDVAVIVGRRFDTQKLVQLRPLELPEPTDPPSECRG